MYAIRFFIQWSAFFFGRVKILPFFAAKNLFYKKTIGITEKRTQFHKAATLSMQPVPTKCSRQFIYTPGGLCQTVYYPVSTATQTRPHRYSECKIEFKDSLVYHSERSCNTTRPHSCSFIGFKQTCIEFKDSLAYYSWRSCNTTRPSQIFRM